MSSRVGVEPSCEKRSVVTHAAQVVHCCTSSLLLLQLVEQASKKFICIVDESKLVDGLGGSKGNCGFHMHAQYT